uniref:Cohesin domain-containing protein n=1 Tax=Eiseniibacteriota bacterium TaxID=2212470 RepID=A0A832MLX8_UNCEI
MLGRCIGATVIAAALFAAAPSRGAVVAVAPSDTAVTLGDTVTVRVETTGVPDLKGFQLVYAYTSPRLQFVGATAGDVLAQGAGDYFEYVLPDVAPPDSVWYDAARLDGTSSGPGVLAFFTFVATSEGFAHVGCRHIEFRDSANQASFPTCLGGLIRVIGPVPSRPASWPRLKGLYR